MATDENKRASAAELIQAVDEQSPKLRAKSLDLSFNELASMYQGDELVVDPEYQRLFRWSLGKRSRFIETLLLEMPVPPIYVIELHDGKYELIDGLQRISSYLHFRGLLPGAADEEGSPFLRLSGCDILKQLDGFTYNELPPPLQIRIKRYFIRVEVIKKESDERLRYYVFKRLNTGGENLTEQEIRNCSIRLLSSTFIDFINDLSQNEDYLRCMAGLSEEALAQRRDQEYVLRFFAFKNHRDHFQHEVGDFMTKYMEAVADPDKTSITFDYREERRIFETTFKILNAIMGQDIFSRYARPSNGKPARASGQLRPNYFEAFSLGVQPYLSQIDISDGLLLTRLKEAFITLRFNEDFAKVTGAGVNYPRPLNTRINMVTETVEAVLNGSY